MTKQAIWLSGILLAASLAWAAEGLNVRTGLWQMTYRTQVATAQGNKASAGPKSWTEKVCVTAKDLKEGAFRTDDKDEENKCTYKMTAQTARLQEGTSVCNGGQGRGQMRIEALSPEKVQGTMSGSGPGFSMNIQMSGQWLSASCAGADED
jgi:hypothetical protein